jgi:hypothetical protein
MHTSPFSLWISLLWGVYYHAKHPALSKKDVMTVQKIMEGSFHDYFTRFLNALRKD